MCRNTDFGKIMTVNPARLKKGQTKEASSHAVYDLRERGEMKGSESKADRKRAREERDRAMDEELVKNYYDQGKRRRHKRNVRIGFCICLAVMLVFSVINWAIVSDNGNVRIDRLKITGSDGAEYSALEYTPTNATDDKPAPAIICFHGNAGNARNHESWAVEFARRGFVVLSIDQFGSGDSQGYFDGNLDNIMTSGVYARDSLYDEADQWYQYLLSMPNVDKSNIISAGHSMGSPAAQALGAKYGAKLIMCASPAGKTQGEYTDIWNSYTGNYVAMTGLVETTAAGGKQDLSKMGLPILNRYPGHEGDTTFETDTMYGSLEDGDGFMWIVEPNRIHEAAFVSQQTIGHLLQYGQEAIGESVPNYIPADNQIWMFKDYTGLFGCLAFAAFLCALTLLLIEEVPVFEAVRRPLARNIGFRGPGLVVASVICALVPYLVAKTDAFGIVGGGLASNLWNAGFHLGFSNMGFGMVIGLNIVAAVGLVVYLATHGRKVQAKLDDFGLTPANYGELQTRGERAKSIVGMALRTLLLTAIVIAVGWGYLQFQLDVFGTDFYSWFFGVKDIPISKIPYYWNYLAVFIICFMIASIDMNIERRLPSTGNETKDLIIGMAVNIVLSTVIIIVIVAVKWHLQTIGSPDDTNWLWSMGLDTQRIWGLPLGVGVAVGGSTFLYKKTGNIWLCAMLIGTVACLMCVLYGGARFHFMTFTAN